MAEYSRRTHEAASRRKGGRQKKAGRRKADGYDKRRRLWAELARQRQGSLVVGKNPLRDTLSFPLGVHTVVLGVQVVSDGFQTRFLTRVRVRVPTLDSFRFRVTPANRLTRTLDRLVPGRVGFDNPRLDREFRVRTNMRGRVRTLFLDGRLRADLLAARPHRFEVARLGWSERRRWAPDVRQLQVAAQGLFLERKELAPLLALCESALSRLESAGAVASRSASKVRASRRGRSKG